MRSSPEYGFFDCWACNCVRTHQPNAQPHITDVIQFSGFGGAGMYSGGLVYIALTTTRKERSIYMSMTATTWGVGTVLGPVVGGSFTVSNLTWRWVWPKLSFHTLKTLKIEQ